VFVDYDFLLHVAFQLTLFFLFCIVIFNLFRSMLLPIIIQEIRAARKHWRALEEKLGSLLRLKSKVEKDLIEQNVKFISLENKIEKWHNAVLLRSKELEKENGILKNNLIEKKKFQSKELYLAKLQQEVVPVAVFEAQREMSENFGGDRGAVLLQELMKKLELKLKK